MKEKELLKKIMKKYNINVYNSVVKNKKFIYFNYICLHPKKIKLILTFKYMNFKNCLDFWYDNYSVFIILIINTRVNEKRIIILQTNYIIISTVINKYNKDAIFSYHINEYS